MVCIADGTTWINNKTGNEYIVLATGIDCTNSRDGLAIVVYHPKGDTTKTYVRERGEFEFKFHEKVKG